jgi:hypothetical protein
MKTERVTDKAANYPEATLGEDEYRSFNRSLFKTMMILNIFNLFFFDADSFETRKDEC